MKVHVLMAMVVLSTPSVALAQSGLFGGEEIQEIGSARCSAGFNLMQVDSNERFLVTAGHCFETPGVDIFEINTGLAEPSQYIGEVAFTSGDSAATADGDVYDLGLIDMTGTADPQGSVIYDTDYDLEDAAISPLGDEGTRLVITEIMHADDIEGGIESGLQVCKTGSSTGTTCGEVAELASNGIFISTICSLDGDSGGAVFTPDRDDQGNLIGTAKALGIVRGSSAVLGPNETRQACRNRGFDGNMTFTPLTTLEAAIGNAFRPLSNKVHITKSNASNFALDGDSGAANGQDVFLWSANAENVNQQWIEIDRGDGYFSYQKSGTSHCIDGNDGGQLGQNVHLWKCSAANENQHWLKVDVGDGAFQLVKRNAADFTIDGRDGGSSRQSVRLWDSSVDSGNLQWTITPVER